MPQITRHPVLWSFLLWAWSHIPANGDLVSLIMFGGFGLLALAGFWLVDSRARQRMGIDRWEELARMTSIVPFAAAAAGRARFGWSLSMTFATVTIFMSLYPRVMVSSLNPDWSLTIYNASSTPKTLTIMSIVALIFVPIVVLYQGYTYWVFRHRVTAETPLEY